MITTPSERIAEAALDVLTKLFTPFDSSPGYCLRIVREIVMEALNMSYDEFKERYWTETVEDNDTGVPWARDMQRSLRTSPYAEAVPFEDRAPGDIVFSHNMAKQGHVAVIAARSGDTTLVIENSASVRGRQISGYNRQSRLEDWPSTEYEVFRLVQT